MQQALATASLALITAVGVSLLPRIPSPPPPSVLLSQWFAAAAAAWMWCLSGEVLQVVFSEHVALSTPGDADALGPLVTALRSSGNPILQVRASYVLQPSACSLAAVPLGIRRAVQCSPVWPGRF
jgi:hypothetical protein